VTAGHAQVQDDQPSKRVARWQRCHWGGAARWQRRHWGTVAVAGTAAVGVRS
jgi:hypothetical protein